MSHIDLIAMLLFASTVGFLLLYVLGFKPGEYHYTFFPVPCRSAAAWLFPLLHFAGAAYLWFQTVVDPVPGSFKTSSPVLVSIFVLYLLSLMVEIASYRSALPIKED